MQITRKMVAEQLGAYLQHRISLEQLVDWAESQVMDSDFESQPVRDVVARLGVADVREFGLTWEDCERMLGEIGFAAQINITTA